MIVCKAFLYLCWLYAVWSRPIPQFSDCVSIDAAKDNDLISIVNGVCVIILILASDALICPAGPELALFLQWACVRGIPSISCTAYFLGLLCIFIWFWIGQVFVNILNSSFSFPKLNSDLCFHLKFDYFRLGVLVLCAIQIRWWKIYFGVVDVSF